MLVLSRKRNESIVVGAYDVNGKPITIVVTCVELRGDKVRLGIEAPKEIPVHRQEVFEAINRQAEIESEAKYVEHPVGCDCPSCDSY